MVLCFILFQTYEMCAKSLLVIRKTKSNHKLAHSLGIQGSKVFPLSSYIMIPVSTKCFISICKSVSWLYKELCGSWNSDNGFHSFLFVNCNKFHCLVIKEIIPGKFLPKVYKKERDFQVLSLELINSAPRFILFQYEFNRGGVEFLLAITNSECLCHCQRVTVCLSFGKNPSKWVAAGDKSYDCTCHFLVIAEAEHWPEAIAAEFLLSPVWLERGVMQM